MPIDGIVQPELIGIDAELRLRRFDGRFDFALGWYQDAETLYLVDGKREPYTMERLEGMYRYLDKRGELYFIELLRDGEFAPIGDVTFSRGDLPIVIGEHGLRGKGIGRRVISALCGRAREFGWSELCVEEIYDWNTASKRCFESVGFRPYKKTERGSAYRIEL
ncbi:MAG TPA: GNAT family N-acetyltransferase [Candidatus Scatomorpha intestinavium]|uniref:GNAT family N-acetyltransferase n=1 Tax=Candidatus Scatomorpha intestinavium TaxID=2840922 RepID=A0A9D0ZH79_9FIRM|nr:GNAT family N-acetyltransferase [Candidatus Scatomorpha intestinavium]